MMWNILPIDSPVGRTGGWVGRMGGTVGRTIAIESPIGRTIAEPAYVFWPHLRRIPQDTWGTRSKLKEALYTLTQSVFYLWVGLKCPTNSTEKISVWGQIRTKSKENSQNFQIFQVPNKFGFSGFPDRKHSDRYARTLHKMGNTQSRHKSINFGKHHDFYYSLYRKENVTSNRPFSELRQS